MKIYLIYQMQSNVLCKLSLSLKDILLTKHKLDWNDMVDVAYLTVLWVNCAMDV